MLAYVIIAIELAILYTVFWYVFLREPQPYKIKGNPWGGYSGAPSGSQPPAFAKPHSFVQGQQNDANRHAIYQEWNVTGSDEQRNGELLRSQRSGVEKSPTVQDKSLQSSTFASQFLAKLGESLNLINVKLP